MEGRAKSNRVRILLITMAVVFVRPTLAGCFDWRETIQNYVVPRYHSFLPFTLSVASPMQKIDPMSPCPFPPARRIVLYAAKGESESAQLLVCPNIECVRAVEIKSSTLIDAESGWVIPSSFVRIREVGYLKANVPNVFGRSKLQPEVLYNQQGADIDPERSVQPYWVTVQVPRKTPAGTYFGTITVTAPDLEPYNLDLVVHVWDFHIPVTQSLPSDFAIRPNVLFSFYSREMMPDGPPDWEKRLPAEDFRMWLEFFLEYRITPQPYAETSGADEMNRPFPLGFYTRVPYLDAHWEGEELKIDWTEADKNWTLLIDGGAKMIRVGYAGHGDIRTGEEGRFWRAYLPQLHQHLKEKGWLDKAYLYGADEPRASLYPMVKSQADMLHELCPGVKYLLTFEGGRPGDSLMGDIDIWCPSIGLYDPSFAKERRANGEQNWVYTCNSSVSRPNLKSYEDSLMHRILPWMMVQQKMDGLLYYGTITWTWHKATLDMVDEKGRLRADWPVEDGGAVFAYPGGKSWLDEPQATTRIENLRDGMEDLECLLMLGKLVEEAKKQNLDKDLIKEAEALSLVPPCLAQGTSDYTKHFQVLETQRHAVSRMVERLARMTQEP